jgi:hypothetical protein
VKQPIVYHPRMIAHYFTASAWVKDMLGMDLDPWQVTQLDSHAQWQIWNCSRQSGKSTLAALLALHTATHYTDSLSLLIAPSLRQSSELFLKVKTYYALLPECAAWKLEEDSTMRCKLKNGSRIIALPGAQETVRGYSAAKLVIMDEAAQCSTDLYRSIRPMLAVSGGRLILPSTPFGKRGFFYDVWNEPSKEWEKRQVVAEQCPRISRDFLEVEKVAQAEWFGQEYEGQFLDVRGGLFSPEMIAQMTVADLEVDRLAKPWLPEDLSA